MAPEPSELAQQRPAREPQRRPERGDRDEDRRLYHLPRDLAGDEAPDAETVDGERHRDQCLNDCSDELAACARAEVELSLDQCRGRARDAARQQDDRQDPQHVRQARLREEARCERRGKEGNGVHDDGADEEERVRRPGRALDIAAALDDGERETRVLQGAECDDEDAGQGDEPEVGRREQVGEDRHDAERDDLPSAEAQGEPGRPADELPVELAHSARTAPRCSASASSL